MAQALYGYKKAHPDSKENSKALALNEFTKWRRNWSLKNHGFEPEIFYWIDFACLDQLNPHDGVPLLPLWVACCERFLKIDSPEYDKRAWCRLEPLLSYVFSFADHMNTIDLDYKCNWPLTGREEESFLMDPNKGKTTDPRDLLLIKELVEISKNSQNLNNKVLNLDYKK